MCLDQMDKILIVKRYLMGVVFSCVRWYISQCKLMGNGCFAAPVHDVMNTTAAITQFGHYVRLTSKPSALPMSYYPGCTVDSWFCYIINRWHDSLYGCVWSLVVMRHCSALQLLSSLWDMAPLIHCCSFPSRQLWQWFPARKTHCVMLARHLTVNRQSKR